MPEIAIGVIGMWWGSVANIPARWILCDGTQGTPDLTDQFVIAAGGAYNPRRRGGSSSHDHDFDADGHTHDIQVGPDTAVGAARYGVTDPTSLDGTTDPTANLPPFYALCYIMYTGVT